VAARLGLGPDWFNKIKTRRSSTGSLITVTDDQHRIAARIIEFGGKRVAYDAAGEPLFFDVDLDYNDVGGKVVPYLGVLPTRFVVTATGDVGAYLAHPDDGAIGSFWTSTVNGQPSYHYNVFHKGTPITPAGASVLAPSSTQRNTVQSSRRSAARTNSGIVAIHADTAAVRIVKTTPTR